MDFSEICGRYRSAYFIFLDRFVILQAKLAVEAVGRGSCFGIMADQGECRVLGIDFVERELDGGIGIAVGGFHLCYRTGADLKYRNGYIRAVFGEKASHADFPTENGCVLHGFHCK